MEPLPEKKPNHTTRLAQFAWLMAAADAVLLITLGALAVNHVREARALPPRFAVVEPGRLYRSGQPTAAQLDGAVKQYGIRTVLNLRNPDKEDDYVTDEASAQPYGVRVVRLAITSTAPLSDEQLSALRKLYGDPHNYPILVHCKEGHARTGVAVAIWRIEQQGWEPAKALDDIIGSGYPVRPENAALRELLLHWKVPARQGQAPTGG